MIVNQINEYLSGLGQDVPQAMLEEVGKLASQAFSRQFGRKEESSRTLRLSGIGRCVRQQAYGVLGFEPSGKEIDSRAKTVFFQGDMAELAIVQLAKQAGCNVTDCGMNQTSVELEGVEGHPDGIYHGDQDYLLEVKSMSSYGFEAFERGEVESSYRYQMNAYMEALGLSKGILVALNKDAGVLAEQIVPRDPGIVENIYERIRLLRAVTKDTLPVRPYHTDSKGFYPWFCRYCRFYKLCLPAAQLVLKGSSYKLYDPTTKPKEN